MSDVIHILEDTQAVISQFFYTDGDKADVGTVDLTAVKIDGTAVALGAGADNIAASGGAGPPATWNYQYTASASLLAAVGILDLTWTADAGTATLYDRLEIVGSTITTEAAIRTADVNIAADTTKYSDEIIADVLWQVIDRLEEYTGRSWCKRYRYYTLEGNGEYEINVRDALNPGPGIGLGGSGGQGAGRDLLELLTVSVDGTQLTPSTDVEILKGGVLRRIDGSTWTAPAGAGAARGNIIIEAAYGLAHPINGVEHIAKTWVRNTLVRSPNDDRTIQQSGELGTTTYVVEGGPMGNETRWPEINQWLADNRQYLGIG